MAPRNLAKFAAENCGPYPLVSVIFCCNTELLHIPVSCLSIFSPDDDDDDDDDDIVLSIYFSIHNSYDAGLHAASIFFPMYMAIQAMSGLASCCLVQLTNQHFLSSSETFKIH